MENTVYEKNTDIDWEIKTKEYMQARSRGQISSLIQRGKETTILYHDITETINQNNEPLVVLGDLNEVDESVVFESLTNNQPVNSIYDTSIDRLPKLVKSSIFTYQLYDAYHLATHQNDTRRAPTNFFRKSGEVLDYILVSNDLNLKNPYHKGIVTSYRVFDSHLKADGISDKKLSDHAQVVATLSLKKLD